MIAAVTFVAVTVGAVCQGIVHGIVGPRQNVCSRPNSDDGGSNLQEEKEELQPFDFHPEDVISEAEDELVNAFYQKQVVISSRKAKT